MGRFCDLPEELLVKIMLRLPVESLVRVKCVQKSWYHLINHKTFVADHLKQSRTDTTPYLFFSCHFFYNGLERKLIVDQFRTISNSNHGEIQHLKSFITGFAPPEFPRHYTFATHCDGIICLSDYHDKFVSFFNPALRQFKFILAPYTPLTKSEPYITGFGHDSINNSYKVIRVFISGCLALVHTLGIDDDNSWREIEIPIPKNYRVHEVSLNDQQLHCRGVYYWLVNAGHPTQMIISFDMHDEKFQIISVPPHDFAYPMVFSLALWNEYVVLFKRHQVGMSLEMWMMHESFNGDYEKCYFWTKHLTIPLLETEVYKPLVFWKNDELILSCSVFIGGRPRLASYNLRTQQFRRLDKLSLIKDTVYAFACIKSLVSIN